MVLGVSEYPADAESVKFPSVSSEDSGWMSGPAARRRSLPAAYYRGTRFRFKTAIGNRRVPCSCRRRVYVIY